MIWDCSSSLFSIEFNLDDEIESRYNTNPILPEEIKIAVNAITNVLINLRSPWCEPCLVIMDNK